MTTYDTIPYPSYSYPQSAPGTLSAIARIFGMQPTHVTKARVLEIGCASGGNLLPLAARYPAATFLGVDLSEKQIEQAKQQASALDLENITFEAKSILEFDIKEEKFDYIIAHGVYSWVPANVQERILEICGENLSNNGVAFVSYNTLPGWNAVKTIRDMMLYHTRNFDEPAQKVLEARRILNFVIEGLEAASGPHKQILEREVNTLKETDDNYLLHDHLEVINDPCYFHEFMEKAGKHGLIYLGDAGLPSMFLGNYTERVSNTLRQIDDTIRQEQYLDFIDNRRFRETLLVKEGCSLNRRLTPAILDGLRFIPCYDLSQPIETGSEGTVENLDLVALQGGRKANMIGKIACVAYVALLRAAPLPQSLDEIAASAADISDIDKKVIRKEFGVLALKLIFNGVLSVTTDNVPYHIKTPSEKPKAFPVARLQSLTMNKVPNLRHEIVTLSNDLKLVFQYVTGENSKEQIAELLKEHIEKGELTLHVNGKPLEKDSPDIEQYLPQYIDARIMNLANSALLVG